MRASEPVVFAKSSPIKKKPRKEAPTKKTVDDTPKNVKRKPVAVTPKKRKPEAVDDDTTQGSKKAKKETTDTPASKKAKLEAADVLDLRPKKGKPAEPLPPPSEASDITEEEEESPAEESPAEGAAGLADDAREGDALALSNFRLSGETLAALQKRGVTALFPIQAATFDLVFEGKDLIGRARTGMGKTLAFALPIVERVRAARTGPARHGRPPCALVMAPTRELAQQVASEVESVASSLTSLCVYGGSPMGPSCNALRSGIDILIGTPGRIKDLAERGVLRLDGIAFATLDEADQMLDMGFAEDMQTILGQCTSESRQTCLFSATLPPWVREVAPKYMRTTPTVVDLVGDRDVKASTDVRHIAIGAPGPVSQRVSCINDAIAMYATAAGRVIVFCDKKSECDELANAEELKLEAKCLHGDIPQASREKTMAAFRAGRFRVLVATDVAARGLDMVVELVVNARPPIKALSGREDAETYVHRSGRTGRAGRKGICVTLVGPRDRNTLMAIERSTKNSFEWLSAPNPTSLLKTAAQTAAADAAAVSSDVVRLFEGAAADLLASTKGDATTAIAAALALATGTTRLPPPRSLITHQDGYATMHATMRSAVPNTGFVWGAIRKLLPEGACEGVDNVRLVKLTADGKGAVFDVAERMLEHMRTAVESGKNEWLNGA